MWVHLEKIRHSLVAYADLPPSGTRSRKDYLKNYGQAAESWPPPEKIKQKELKFDKALKKKQKEPAENLQKSFQFDILMQLVNIPTRITLYELLKLSKSTREVLREALQDSEVFLIQIPEMVEKEKYFCMTYHQTSGKNIPCIIFFPEYMQVRSNKYHCPLYYKGYIRSAEIDRIQVDLGSALSIMPWRMLRYFGVR